MVLLRGKLAKPEVELLDLGLPELLATGAQAYTFTIPEAALQIGILRGGDSEAQGPSLQKPESQPEEKTKAGRGRQPRSPPESGTTKYLQRRKRMRTDYLLQREVEQVLGCLMPSNRLAVRVSLHTGLRIGDVLALRTEQLKPQFWITEEKTGKRRRVGLPGPLLDDLRQHAGKEWVFPHRTDPKKHRTRQAVWKDIKRAAEAYRLPQNVGTHSARKVYAVQLMDKYGDLDRVRKALNHSKRYPSTTYIYAMADHILEDKFRRRGRKKA